MKLPRVSLCYYPTSIMLVDDEKEYLKFLSLKLTKHWPCHSYHNPKTALTFISDEYKFSPYINRCNTSNDDVHIDHIKNEINIRNVHREIYNPDRFAEISVIIVDYNMPAVNGIEFARKVRETNPLIKIIMLTGQADQSLAVDAFNNGIIDKFLLKTSQNLVEILLQTIQDSQLKYFSDLSDKCLNNINSSNRILRCLNDPAFTELFSKICSEHHIVEYYLMDEQGSFLLLTADGCPSWLAIKSEQDIVNYYEYGLLEQAPEAVINALKSKQSILYFHTEDDLQAPPSEWNKYLHSAKTLVGKETYYYAYIDDPKAYDIQLDKIISYEHYLDQLD